MRNFSQWHAKFVSDHGGKEPSVADAWNGAVCNCLDHPASSVVEDAASLRTLIAQCGVMLYSASDDAMSRLAQALNHHPTVVQQPDAGEPVVTHIAPAIPGVRGPRPYATPVPVPQVAQTAEGKADPYNYKGMFESAVSTLARIDRSLGLPDDGCNDPQATLRAIADLVNARSAFDIEAAAKSIASMVTEWVKDGPRGSDWTAGLPGIIARRLKRFTAPPHSPIADSGDETIKEVYVRVFGSDTGWLDVQGSYFITGFQAAALAAQPKADSGVGK